MTRTWTGRIMTIEIWLIKFINAQKPGREANPLDDKTESRLKKISTDF